jgi:hypothetical protein
MPQRPKTAAVKKGNDDEWADEGVNDLLPD